MSLWIELAHEGLPGMGKDVCSDVVRTFQTDEQFFALLASDTQGGEQAVRVADEAAAALERGLPPDQAAEAALAALARDAHVPLSILWVEGACESHACVARVMECDAPPMFLVQDRQLILLPVVEEESLGRLVRRCRFRLGDGDHLAMVSEGYLHPRRQGWGGIALAVKRWTDTNCDAQELLGALLRTYRRLNPEPPRQDVTVVAMHVRQMRTATIWTGPPADPNQDAAALRELMAEQGTRIICGGTTSQIAARVLEAELEMEPRPADGWEEVPPTFHLEGVDLVTEGLVTLRKTRERIEGVQRTRDLPRGGDGAARLARALLAADKLHFIVGLAANPQQVDDAGAPLRKGVVAGLIRDLEAHGKLVSVAYC